MVTASYCQERAGNLVDGTDSEWWTGEETAWVEVDLGRVCRVERLSLQWWGVSISRDYTILAAAEDGDFHEVQTRDGEVESPEGCNSWSRLPGWPQDTRRIRIELREGCLDPWDMGKWFGMRRLEVEGQEQEVVTANNNIQQVLERKARRCLAGNRAVQAEVCRLIRDRTNSC